MEVRFLKVIGLVAGNMLRIIWKQQQQQNKSIEKAQVRLQRKYCF